VIGRNDLVPFASGDGGASACCINFVIFSEHHGIVAIRLGVLSYLERMCSGIDRILWLDYTSATKDKNPITAAASDIDISCNG